MKFLTKTDWQKIIYKLNLKNKNSERIENLFCEISQRLKDLSAQLFDHTTYGIAMTLLHYYTSCFQSIRDFDPIEISFACLYMSSKIQFINYPLKKFVEQYKNYVKDKQGYNKKSDPDFIKYEIELYSLLGYDLDIETPYQFFYHMLPKFYALYPDIKTKNDKLMQLKNFCFNLINDTYIKPFCIYYHPKIIYLSCLIFSLKFLQFEECSDLSLLIKEEKLELITECMDNILLIYMKYLKDKDKNSVKKE